MMGTQARPPTRNPVEATARPTPQPRSGNPDTRADDLDIVEVWGRDSFPASDPPANW
jgi:hypothetical protein